MEGFKLVCKQCGAEVDYNDIYDASNEADIQAEIGYECEVNEIWCKCGNREK